MAKVGVDDHLLSSCSMMLCVMEGAFVERYPYVGCWHYSVSGSLLKAVPLLPPFQRLVSYEEGK